MAATVLLVACAARSPAEENPDVSAGSEGTSGPRPSPSPAAALDLSLCPMRVSNAPANIEGRIFRPSPLACLNGVRLHLAPAPGACLSSGFGRRSGRNHRGIDYHSRPAVDVVAAAAGSVRVAAFRERDFGNWVVVDHGDGVLTGYAHLAGFAEGIEAGETVEAGQRLGRMGSTGRASRAVHLHYEVRRGDFDNPKRWWGLTPLDPFALPQGCAPGS